MTESKENAVPEANAPVLTEEAKAVDQAESVMKFPMDFPIKVMGLTVPALPKEVAAIVAMVILEPALWPCIVTLGSLPKAFRLVGELTQKRHEELNAVMFGCVRLEGLFAMLFSAGALAAAWA